MTDLPPYPVPRTEAGRRLLADGGYWPKGPRLETILAIEAEALAARSAEIAVAVKAIRKREVRQGGEPGLDSTDVYIAVILDAVLAIVGAEPAAPRLSEPKKRQRIDWSDVVVDEGDEAP